MSGHVNFDLQLLHLSVGVIEWPAHKVNKRDKISLHFLSIAI